ncbi:transglycosylase SLT domain protein [Burkholderia pseudomallei]|nr:transglycosylase SLT domain protein [Burkholderia pseudomallei]CAJ3602694.1 transglycosylase SLT domain protein [Burkholderia pseudomallei]CAJ3646230.1 transglycosylase SLT domain protein [Burkholderia pseudomallei]CAJ3707140.1 transglycosylase SLT domain protein [Burkholderia pseudomallei]CAJ3750529.1 transglycosylase SLT domain protein [Burkholderia pseudomallei]
MMTPFANRARRLVCAIPLLMAVHPSLASNMPPPAYQLAAHDAGVPSVVLFAVALQESGMHIRGRLIPWPWTLNVVGTAYRFRTRTAACVALHGALSRVGATRIDVGLAQINLGYQGWRFDRPCDALDPYRNLAVAAVILREQHAVSDDWLVAVGRYHHPAGGVVAARYRRQVGLRLAHVLDATPSFPKEALRQ